MKYIAVLLMFVSASVGAQSILGKWKTTDDKSGKEKSVIEIFQKSGKVFGKVVSIFPIKGEDPDPICSACDENDDRYNKKVIGMEILRDMEAVDGESYDEGEILDPELGRVYRCKLWLEDGDLMVRGYWGPFFRTQTWKRVN
jgi:uncharacterized protein (DUF2147 family)